MLRSPTANGVVQGIIITVKTKKLLPVSTPSEQVQLIVQAVCNTMKTQFRENYYSQEPVYQSSLSNKALIKATTLTIQLYKHIALRGCTGLLHEM